MSVLDCIHGELDSETGTCQCDHFWQGADCSVPTCISGILNTTTSACRCNHGYGGQFCHVEVCLHNDQWYCDFEDSNDRQVCPGEILGSWTPPATSEASWLCSCGSGARTFLNNGSVSTCVCEQGYYGPFCRWKPCGDGAVWDFKNGTCVEDRGELQLTLSNDSNGSGHGVFGFDLSGELLLASILMAGFLIALLVVVRVCARRLRRSGRASSDGCLERIAVDEFRTRRSHRMPFVVTGETSRSKRNGGAGNADSDFRAGYSSGWRNGVAPYWASFNNMFSWRNGAALRNDQQAQVLTARPIRIHRLTTVEEESSDVDESMA